MATRTSDHFVLSSNDYMALVTPNTIKFSHAVAPDGIELGHSVNPDIVELSHTSDHLTAGDEDLDIPNVLTLGLTATPDVVKLNHAEIMQNMYASPVSTPLSTATVHQSYNGLTATEPERISINACIKVTCLSLTKGNGFSSFLNGI